MFLFVRKYCMDCDNIDLDYVIEQIADAYTFILDSLEENDLERAQFWEQQLSLLVHHLDKYQRKVL